MQQVLRFVVVAAGIALCSWATSSPANDVETTQIKLSEKNVEDFIAAHRDAAATMEKIQGAALSDRTKTKYQSELDTVIRRHGFKNLAEYELVSANISLVVAAIDPQTKAFCDPHTAIKKEIENLRADRTLPDREKKQSLRELNEALKSVQPIEFPANIELVKKYYDKIDFTIVAGYDSESPSNSSVVRTISE